ncbi:fatty acid desaturase CarF family protein [Rhizobium ruizarguesonis]
MTTLEFPQSFKPLIILSVASVVFASVLIAGSPQFNLPTAILLFVLSGFFADLLTAFFHFGFDYVFSYSMPILGPIAREFREHHEHPTLDPSNYAVNLTKGSYASFPLSMIGMSVGWLGDDSGGLFLLSGTITGMSIWALFFHQIHAYAHMGSHIHPEEFKARVAEIAQLKDQREQIRQLDHLFDTLPIPKTIRVLQRSRILLNPAIHNLHHIKFESDFSSVNGWSDPLTNPLFGVIARHYKEKNAGNH